MRECIDAAADTAGGEQAHGDGRRLVVTRGGVTKLVLACTRQVLTLVGTRASPGDRAVTDTEACRHRSVQLADVEAVAAGWRRAGGADEQAELVEATEAPAPISGDAAVGEDWAQRPRPEHMRGAACNKTAGRP